MNLRKGEVLSKTAMSNGTNDVLVAVDIQHAGLYSMGFKQHAIRATYVSSDLSNLPLRKASAGLKLLASAGTPFNTHAAQYVWF